MSTWTDARLPVFEQLVYIDGPVVDLQYLALYWDVQVVNKEYLTLALDDQVVD